MADLAAGIVRDREAVNIFTHAKIRWKNAEHRHVPGTRRAVAAGDSFDCTAVLASAGLAAGILCDR